MQIYLLGRPRAAVRGVPLVGPRGRKAWALLGLLLLSDRPPSRRQLARILFPDADDPLGALRWTLSQLRRAFADDVNIEGDPVVIRLATTVWVDITHQVDERSCGGPAAEVGVAPVGRLLEGLEDVAGEEFDLWLTSARHRIDAARGNRLRTAAERAAAAAEPSLAVVAAAGAVQVEPLDMIARGALVGSLAAAGDHHAALSQLRQWSRWIRQELQLTELMADGEPANRRNSTRLSDPDVDARLEVGRAAMSAGAVLAGLDHLRDAVRLAAVRRDEQLQARALFTLGSAVVHGVAAHSTEGAQALHEAARLAQRVGNYSLVAETLRDLAFVANASGQHAQVRRLLREAGAAAGDDRSALSSVRGVEGMFLADRGQHRRALDALRSSARLAESTGRPRQVAWSLSFASRSLLQCQQLDKAEECAEQSRQLAVDQHWTTMLPWTEALLAELDLAAGRVEVAARRLQHAWSLSSVLGDWTWQAMTARGLGLVAFARGDADGAVRWLDVATSRAVHRHDHNPWIDAYARDALCRVAAAARLPRARADLRQLAALAVRTHQPDFTARVRAHQTALDAV